jgi:TonB family protein
MGYHALLFCPDEKTARTVTQVLSELEFNVEACTEPFAAVKKLMGEHFDALVVDCDNEQNATLLFKSARSSTSNQASLAVAVVEGQAGVAKAFRIGANLVLTKPINVEQAKGTLRVARGLLRKGEPTKSGNSVAPPSSTAAPTKPVPLSPARPSASSVPAPRPVPPVASAVNKPAATLPSIPKRAAGVPVATANSVSRSIPADPIETSPNEVKATSPVANLTAPTIVAAAPPSPPATTHSALSNPSLSNPRFGSAAATAPALEPVAPSHEIEQPVSATSTPSDAAVAQPEASFVSESMSSNAQAPTFTFGGGNAPEAPSSGSKKVLIGVAATVVIAGAFYFGWTQFKGGATKASSPTNTLVPAPVATQTSTPTSQPVPVTPAATPATTTTIDSAPASPTAQKTPLPATLMAASAPSTTSTLKRPVADSAEPPVLMTDRPTSLTPESNALLVRNGKTSATVTKTGAPDAQAPSMIGMATASDAPLTNLVGSNSTSPAPVLQRMNISQGVSQGLLIKKVQPQYPATALNMHVEGAVQVVATISKSGDISAVKVVSGDALLTKAAADAVKQWKYKPYLLNGEPVEIQTQITLNFKLPH